MPLMRMQKAGRELKADQIWPVARKQRASVMQPKPPTNAVLWESADGTSAQCSSNPSPSDLNADLSPRTAVFTRHGGLAETGEMLGD